jgi:hypothetical protein
MESSLNLHGPESLQLSHWHKLFRVGSKAYQVQKKADVASWSSHQIWAMAHLVLDQSSQMKLLSSPSTSSAFHKKSYFFLNQTVVPAGIFPFTKGLEEIKISPFGMAYSCALKFVMQCQPLGLEK